MERIDPRRILFLLSLFLLFSPSLAQFERPALVSFYNALGGPNWINDTNWLSEINHCEWFGVVCAGSFNTVVGLRLPLNNLKGRLPQNFFDGFPFIFGLDLSSNVISGTLDDSICKRPFLSIVELSLNILEGNLPNCWKEDSMIYYFGVRYNRFTGFFPETFGNFKNVTAIDLSENRLEGPIPEYFCRTNVTLRFLILLDNLFNGSIPECMGSFQIIDTVVFDANRFTGKLPEGLLALKSLDSFSASGNNFEGTIPDVFSEDQILRILWFGKNNLSGNLPDSLHKLSRLIEIRWENNGLEGEIPPNWNKFVKLKSVLLANNRLSGIFPVIPTILLLNLQNNSFNGNVQFLSKTPLIQFLDLSHNSFSGRVPYNLISNSTELAHISLNNNNFSGPLFDLQAIKLAPVNFIDVSFNQFSGQISLAFLPQLTTFKINNNNMQGYIYAFGSSDILSVMDYSNNQFIGPIPSIVGFITSLQVFRVDNNKLVGGFPDQMADLPKLKTFTCSGNRLEAFDISVLTKIPSLEIVDISHNRINATLPESMGNLKNLQQFDASDNFMRGKVPNGLFTIPDLSVLNLANNSFEGGFSSVGGSAVLIDLSDNNFEGEVDWISSLTAIQTLKIQNNRFSGQVQDMSPNKQCSHLDLSHNMLIGDFPAISQLTKLVYLNASFNQFTGNAPQLDGSEYLEVLDLSHNSLKDGSILSYLPSLKTCSLDFNSFECPVTWQAFQMCQATCQVTPGGSSTLRLRVVGDLNTFDSERFKSQVATVGNFTQSRLKVLNLSSGSVIADIEVSPPSSQSTNEGSSSRVVEILTRIARSDKEKFGKTGLEVLSVSEIPKDTESSNQLSKGAIAGIVIAVVAVFGILIVIMILLFIRSKRRVVVTNQFAMIDVSTLNLGAAKKSIIPYNELSEMEHIGAGAFGVVYRAKWRELDVAVKQIRAEFVSEELLKDFLQEIAILQGLRSHPNVVLFLAVTFPPEPLSMITELCEGGSLYSYLRENQVDLEQKKRFIAGIALGMLHLHSEKIVHRDLAVRNILLTKHLDPKVSDFGLSREQTSHESTSVTSSAVGPLKWMSPEAIKNRQYSTKSDSFSFGVCIWEILTVSDPYPEHTPMETAFLVVVEDQRLPIPPGTDPILASIMTSCWERDPTARPDMTQIYATLGGEGGNRLVKNDSFLQKQMLNTPSNYDSLTSLVAPTAPPDSFYGSVDLK